MNSTITLTKAQKNTFDSNLYKRDFLDPEGDGVMYTKLDLELFLNHLLFSMLNGHDRYFTYAEELQFVPTLLEKLGIKWYPMNDRSMILRLAEIAS